jgi:hypothetical protein
MHRRFDLTTAVILAVALLAACTEPDKAPPASTEPAVPAAGPRERLVDAFNRHASEPTAVGLAAVERALNMQAAPEGQTWTGEAQAIAERCVGAAPETSILEMGCYAAGCLLKLHHTDDSALDAFFEQVGAGEACQGWPGERLAIKAFARGADGSPQSALVFVVPMDS